MYTKGILERYAETIHPIEEGNRLKKEIENIKYEDINKTICVVAEAEAAFVRAELSALIPHFKKNYDKFITDEDYKNFDNFAYSIGTKYIKI